MLGKGRGGLCKASTKEEGRKQKVKGEKIKSSLLILDSSDGKPWIWLRQPIIRARFIFQETMTCRPKKRWRDQIRSDLGLPINTAEGVARDRDACKNLTDGNNGARILRGLCR